MVAAAGAQASVAGFAGLQIHVMTVTMLTQRDGESVTATPATTPLLKNEGSFITVHTRPTTAGEATAATEMTRGRMIEVPRNARAGDPAYAVVEEEAYWDEGAGQEDGAYERTYGIAFAEGVNLGYTRLHRHEQRRGHRPVRPSDEGAPEFGSSDLHRRAVLRFGEAAQARLEGLDEGFRRAQLTFHRATLTPGVRREADGLRHERTGSRPERPSRPRTQW